MNLNEPQARYQEMPPGVIDLTQSDSEHEDVGPSKNLTSPVPVINFETRLNNQEISEVMDLTHSDSEYDHTGPSKNLTCPVPVINFETSSKEGSADSLDIIPPQVALKSDVALHEKKKTQHSQKRECVNIDDHFRFLNKIAVGTFGEVYKAKDNRTKKIVAVKCLKTENRNKFFSTYHREIDALRKADHTNLITVHEIVLGNNKEIYIIMDYVKYNMTNLMLSMKHPFQIGEVKTLMLQILDAVEFLHEKSILHQDLKISNLFINDKGILQVADFGLAREYGSPLKSCTLWYRAPELLLGEKIFCTPADMWSVGCIYGELLTNEPLFPGLTEIDQLNRIFKDLGMPSDEIWPGYSELPLVKKTDMFQGHVNNKLRCILKNNFTDLRFDLLNRFLEYNPGARISAKEAKSHMFFKELPKPVSSAAFSSLLAEIELCPHKAAQSSPKHPSSRKQYARQMEEADEGHSTKEAG